MRLFASLLLVWTTRDSESNDLGEWSECMVTVWMLEGNL